MESIWLITGDINLDHSRRCLPDFAIIKLLFSLSVSYSLEAVTKSSSNSRGKVMKYHLLLEGGVPKNLWTYVKTTTVINKYNGKSIEATQVSYLKYPWCVIHSFYHSLMDLTCSNYHCGMFLIPPTFINWTKNYLSLSSNSLFIQSIYISMDMQIFILLFGLSSNAKCYQYLFHWSICSRLAI